MRVLVCGDRNWKDRDLIAREIDKVRRSCRDGELLSIVEGEADGADKMARQYGISVGILVIGVHADWKTYGRAAGPIRNQKMLDDYKPDQVLAFHDNIGASSGTKDMIERTIVARIPYRLITHEENK